MSNTQLYFVGCICTTLIEHTTACSFLDEEHEHPDHFSGNDSNRYTFGKIAGHNVVIVAPSRGNGHIVIETMTKDLFDTFANIRICLLVGLGGGAPTTKHETRLGDVVVGSPTDGTGAIYQYDNDKTIQKKCFVHISSLDRPWDVVLAAMPSFSSKYMLQAHQIQKSIKAVLAREAKPHKINSHQSQESDQLYQSITTVPHRGSWKRLCESQDMLLRRQGHNHRDDKATILYSETRASGLPYRVPCLVYLEQVPGYSPINRLSVPGSIAKSCSGLEMRVQIKEVADGRVLDRVGEVQLSRYLVKICLVSKSLDGPDRNQMNRQCALLETSANSGFHNKDFGIPLQAASSRGHMSLVRTLLERGADVNLNGGKYGNALYAAPERGYGRIMRLLLGLGVEVNVQGGVYSTALQVAVHEGHDKFLQALLQNGASVNAQKGGHDALLHLASEKGHEKVVRILLDLGADLPMTDRSGPMPLHAALRKGMVQTGELLLAQRRIRSLLQCSNGNGDRTPLNHTSKNGHMEVLKLPIHSITAIKAMDSRVRTTSHVAVINGHPKIPRLEVDGGAQIEPQGTECGYLPSAAQPHASFTARLKIYITKACNLLGAFQKPLSNGYTRIIWKNVNFLLLRSSNVEVILLIEFGAEIQSTVHK